jgi:hypothetical protein
MISKRQIISDEQIAAAVIAGVLLIFFAPIWLRGHSPFWGDLTYLHHAWRSSPAQQVQSGQAPLWEPSLYLGMPMAASMQGGLFYPATLVYYFFGFATGTAMFEFLHLFVGASRRAAGRFSGGLRGFVLAFMDAPRL